VVDIWVPRHVYLGPKGHWFTWVQLSTHGSSWRRGSHYNHKETLGQYQVFPLFDAPTLQFLLPLLVW